MSNEAIVPQQNSPIKLNKPNKSQRQKALERLAFEMTAWYGDDEDAFRAAVKMAEELAARKSARVSQAKTKTGEPKTLWAYTMPTIKAHMRSQYEDYARTKDADLLATRALAKRQKANNKK